MALDTYRAKQRLTRTPEPRGAGRGPGNSFVVQKHAASHLHYDFRLELDGVLLSWAVPKGPSLDPRDKRLAMAVEDHPVEYGGFEGVIPEGEYGGGTVMLWDRGTWSPIGDPREGLAAGHLKFELRGEKLEGTWHLVRTRNSKYGGKGGDRAWLLMKEEDAFARRDGAPIVEAAATSVASGRDMQAIASARERVWSGKSGEVRNTARPERSAGAKSRAPANKNPTASPRGRAAVAGAVKVMEPSASRKPLGRKAAMPSFVEPALALLVSEAPAGDGWIHEIKYDGYRMVASIVKGKARLLSRNGKEWTASFPSIVRDLSALAVQSAWVDGEVAVVDAQGRTSFQALQNALSGATTEGLVFFAFDVMYLDGMDVRAVPLAQRKELLQRVVGDGHGDVRRGVEFTGDGQQFLAQACKLGLEGSISKRADSVYGSGKRTGEWRKIKCIQRQEMVIGGYTLPQGSRTGFGALLLGHYEEGKLRYAGKVGTGFDERTLRSLHPELVRRERDTPAFANPPRGYEAKGARWVTPDLVAEIAFTEWSRDGALRHPSFQGLRPDKKASEVVREKPVDVAPSPAPPVAASTTRSVKAAPSALKGTRKAAAKTVADAKRSGAGRANAASTPSEPTAASPARGARFASATLDIAGVVLSNPDKLYFPESGITKSQIAAYYAAVAPWIVPHLTGRPLSLVRCPDGWNGQCFYQKHADKAVNAAVDRVEVPEGTGTSTYMAAGSATALVGLVQWGVIEMHPWGSRIPRLAKPDRLVFDFDPDEGVPFVQLVEGVQLLRTLLTEMGLAGFLKTTGGKGLHIVVPIRATLGWEGGKAFARSVAEFMVNAFPDRFVATASKARRKGRIFLDWLRNAEGATAVAPFSVRARAGAPVAMPIAWEELDDDVRGDHFNVRTAVERLESGRPDPWAEFFSVRQSITAAVQRKLAKA